jgi:formate hydrogenlyase subunit 6/NADH:ubiquinone oxidoreductase subunit I
MMPRAMPFTRTEADPAECFVEARDATWFARGPGSPKHLMLDPDHCILCGACEDVCPWSCISATPTGILDGADGDIENMGMGNTHVPFVVNDATCVRCSVCVDRCPTDALYYARLPEGGAAVRTMASVPLAQRTESD